MKLLKINSWNCSYVHFLDVPGTMALFLGNLPLLLNILQDAWDSKVNKWATSRLVLKPLPMNISQNPYNIAQQERVRRERAGKEKES